MTRSSAPVLDKEELRRIVAQVLCVEPAEVGDDVDFVDDLEVDSLLALEVVVVLEKRFGVRLTEAEMRRISTLRTAHELLQEKLHAPA